MEIVDVLTDLLAERQRGPFHFMAEADPYINRASAEVRRPLQEMIAESARQEGELVELLAEQGVTPLPVVNPEHQYLAFLTVDFLLPKLKEDKLRAIAAYEGAIRRIGDADPRVAEVLASHLERHRADVAVLDRAIAHHAGQAAAKGK